MDAKIQEIQIMARRGCTIETEEHSDSKEDESDKQTSSKLPQMEELAEVAMDSVSGELVMHLKFKLQVSCQPLKRGLFKGKQQVTWMWSIWMGLSLNRDW